MRAHAPDVAFKMPPLTALQVFEMLPEGTLVEVIDNAIQLRPMPSLEHQDILGCTCAACFIHITALKLGKCVTALMDVYLNDRNVVQPGILFISNANLGIIKNGKIKGTPDLIVEILSANHKYDTKTKKDLYETFGVKEYFIVDPDTKEATTYYHNGNKYVKQDTKKGKIVSMLLGKEFDF